MSVYRRFRGLLGELELWGKGFFDKRLRDIDHQRHVGLAKGCFQILTFSNALMILDCKSSVRSLRKLLAHRSASP